MQSYHGRKNVHINIARHNQTVRRRGFMPAIRAPRYMANPHKTAAMPDPTHLGSRRKGTNTMLASLTLSVAMWSVQVSKIPDRGEAPGTPSNHGFRWTEYHRSSRYLGMPMKKKAKVRVNRTRTTVPAYGLWRVLVFMTACRLQGILPSGSRPDVPRIRTEGHGRERTATCRCRWSGTPWRRLCFLSRLCWRD